jgi:hypothetical protein
MLQQMVNRSSTMGTPLSRSGHTRTAISSHNKSERPPSSSSEVELTRNKGGFGGITKTIGWETQQETWSNAGEEQDNRSNLESTNIASARSSSSPDHK